MRLDEVIITVLCPRCFEELEDNKCVFCDFDEEEDDVV